MKMVSKTKPPIFLIKKKKFLARKRTISPSVITNKKIEKEKPIETSNELPKEPLNNSVNFENINKSKLKSVKWTEKEDNLLIKCVETFGEGKWNEMEKCFLGRTRKQIRQRYISNIKLKKITEKDNQKTDLNQSISSIEEKSIDINME